MNPIICMMPGKLKFLKKLIFDLSEFPLFYRISNIIFNAEPATNAKGKGLINKQNWDEYLA